MTIQREEPGLFAAVCDQCGERRVLNIDAEAEQDELNAALEALRWVRRAPLRQKFQGAGIGRGQTLTYEQDFCPDCQTGDPGPAPLYGKLIHRPHVIHNAFENDPCDEWPRPAVFSAAGLRPECGHPVGGLRCDYCDSGLPIGHTSAWWKR